MRIQILLTAAIGLLYCVPVLSQQDSIEANSSSVIKTDNTTEPSDSEKAKQYIENNWPAIEAKSKASQVKRLKREKKKQDYEKRLLILKNSMIAAGATQKEANEVLKTVRENIGISAWPLWVKKEKFESKAAWRFVTSAKTQPYRVCGPTKIKPSPPQPVYIIASVNAQSPFQVLDIHWKSQNPGRIKAS